MDLGDLKQASEGADGVWFGPDVHGLSGVELCVRSMAHPSVVRAIGRLSRRASANQLRQGKDGKLTGAQQDAIEDAAVAEAALIDWKGLTHNGEPLPYSVSMAEELVELPPFWRALRACCNEATRADTSAMEVLAKNSQTPSNDQRPAAS